MHRRQFRLKCRLHPTAPTEDFSAASSQQPQCTQLHTPPSSSARTWTTPLARYAADSSSVSMSPGDPFSLHDRMRQILQFRGELGKARPKKRGQVHRGHVLGRVPATCTPTDAARSRLWFAKAFSFTAPMHLAEYLYKDHHALKVADTIKVHLSVACSHFIDL